jgi:hypothetical protein
MAVFDYNPIPFLPEEFKGIQTAALYLIEMHRMALDECS